MQRIYARRLMIITLALIVVLVLAFSVLQGGLPF
jgi:hypothetical protein